MQVLWNTYTGPVTYSSFSLCGVSNHTYNLLCAVNEHVSQYCLWTILKVRHTTMCLCVSVCTRVCMQCMSASKGNKIWKLKRHQSAHVHCHTTHHSHAVESQTQDTHHTEEVGRRHALILDDSGCNVTTSLKVLLLLSLLG